MAKLNVWMRNFRSRNTETKCYCFVFCLSPLTLAQVTLLSWPLLEAFGFKMIRSVLWCPVAIRSTGDWVKWATCSLFNRWYKKLFMASSHHPWLYLWLENLLHHPITKGRMLLKLEICHALILFFIFSCFFYLILSHLALWCRSCCCCITNCQLIFQTTTFLPCVFDATGRHQRDVQ